MSAITGEMSCKINVFFGPPSTPLRLGERREKLLCGTSPTEPSWHSVTLGQWCFIDFSGCFSPLLFKTLSSTEVRQESPAWSWSKVRGQQAAPGDSGLRNVTPQSRSLAVTVLPWRWITDSIQPSPFRMSSLVSCLLTGAAPMASRPEMAPEAFPVLFPDVRCKWKRHWPWAASWPGTYPARVTGDRGCRGLCLKRRNQTSYFSRGQSVSRVCSSRQSSWPFIPPCLTVKGYCHLGFARFVCPAV